MKIVPYIFYLFLITFHNTILSGAISIWDARIDLVVLIVALVALYKGELVGIWFAFSAAVVAGSLRLDLIPWEMLVLGLSALIIHQVSLRVNLESITTRMIILAAIILFHQLVMALVISAETFLYSGYKVILPSIIYTLVPGWLFFQFKDGNITWAKIKSVF